MDTKFERIKKLLKAFDDPFEDDEIVYHYTTAEGLKGIIERGEIWLTNTEFVNDITECKSLWKERELLKYEDFSNNDVREAWAELTTNRIHNRSNRYIISFSKDKDSLSQWRSYGSFCIGFAAKELIRSGFTLHKCLYEKEEIRQWILDKENIPEWKGEWEMPPTIHRNWQRQYAARNLMSIASIKYKNRSYREEKEVRLTVVSEHDCLDDSFGMYESQPPIHFRDDPVLKVSIPYVKFFVPASANQRSRSKGDETIREMKKRRLDREINSKRDLLPIREIMVGPMVYQKPAILSCEILVHEKGYKDVPVAASEIPYRGF